VIATGSLEEQGAFNSETQGKKNVVQAIKMAAEHLGNTPAICRKCYVHPGVIAAYLDRSLLNFMKHYDGREKKRAPDGLHPEEAGVLAFLEQLSTK
jgi:DNA topoisomerase I